MSHNSTSVQVLLHYHLVRIANMANTFLINNHPVFGPHMESCFCATCRNSEVDDTLYRRNMSAQMLHTAFVTTLTQTRETMLDMQFEVTKQEIVIGYSFKKRCLEGTGYLSFGCWIANAPIMAHLSDVEKDVLCDKISVITTVFEKWETIVENLTRPSMQVIDARKYSIYQFSRAVNYNWCVRQRNELLQKIRGDVQNTYYCQVKFRQIMDLVESSGILNDVAHCRDQARLLAEK